MTDANEGKLMQALMVHNGQLVDVELLNGTEIRGELSVHGSDSDYIRVTVQAAHGRYSRIIPLAALAAVSEVPESP